MDTHPPEAWKRLGVALQRRRVQLGYGYRQRLRFTTERGHGLLSEKTIARLERGERPAYPTVTLAAVEEMYAIQPGAIDAFMRGAPLLPTADEPPRPPGPHPADYPEGPLRRIAADPDLTAQEKLALIDMAVRLKESRRESRG